MRDNGETTSLLLSYLILLQRSLKFKKEKIRHLLIFYCCGKKCSTRFGGSGGFLLDEDTGTLRDAKQNPGSGGGWGQGGGYNHAKSTLILPRRHVRLPNSAALKSAGLKPLGGREVRICGHVLFNKATHIRGSSGRGVSVMSVPLVSDCQF